MVRLIWLFLARVFAVLFDPFAGRQRVPGTRIVLHGKAWVFAPVNLGFVEDNAARIEQFGDAGALESGQVALTIDAATASLRRNYWWITRRRVRRMLDVASFGPVMAACWGGALRGAEDSAQGEAVAPAK